MYFKGIDNIDLVIDYPIINYTNILNYLLNENNSLLRQITLKKM